MTPSRYARRMGYPKRLLSDDEEIVSEFRPHWSAVLREILLLILGLIAIGLLAANVSLPGWVYGLIVAVMVLLTIGGFVRWFVTQHVITNERVIYRAGLISKKGKEIPLEVINDVAFTQTMFERVFGTGDLLIESAGTHGQSRYRDIPKPEQVQKLIYEAREPRMAQMRGGAAAIQEESTASQLATLSKLHDEGKLTDAEFEAEKRKLTGGV